MPRFTMFVVGWVSISRAVIGLSVLLGFPAAGSTAAAGAAVTGETNRPSVNTFVKGEAVNLTFTVAGIVRPDTLSIEVKDENGHVVASHSLAISKPGAVSVAAPGDRFGFFRVEAKLSADGTTLPAIGTRGAGFLTYAVVPDPEARPLFPDAETRFGLQGSSALAYPYLGRRWVLGGYAWRNLEPKAPGQYDGKPDRSPTVSYHGKPWPTFDLPTLYVKPPSWARTNQKIGPVSPAHEQDWARYAAKVAKAYAQSHPDRTRNVYQITWEPDRNWDNWDGDDASLVRLHELAYKAIHEADPKAEVIGPAISPMWAIVGDYGAEVANAQAFSTREAHGSWMASPFIPTSTRPRAHKKHAWLGITRLNWPSQFRARMNKFLTMWYLAKGTNARFYGTEVGLVLLNEENSSGPDLLHQARFDVVQFLEFLGMGATLNFGFYDVDWDIGKNTFEKGQHRGYYYNLDKVGWGPRIISPKPVAPAYAACSWFLEGHTSPGQSPGCLANLTVTSSSAARTPFSRHGTPPLLMRWRWMWRPSRRRLSRSTTGWGTGFSPRPYPTDEPGSRSVPRPSISRATPDPPYPS